MEVARIHAQNAIRKKNESLNMLRLAAKMDAVASKLDTAVRSQEISQNMKEMVPELDKVIMSMQPEEMAENMDQFEKLFDDRREDGARVCLHVCLCELLSARLLVSRWLGGLWGATGRTCSSSSVL